MSETRIVSPILLGEQLLEGEPGLDDAVGRQPRLGHAQMERNVGTALGEAAIGVEHLGRIGVLERDHEAREAELDPSDRNDSAADSTIAAS